VSSATDRSARSPQLSIVARTLLTPTRHSDEHEPIRVSLSSHDASNAEVMRHEAARKQLFVSNAEP
jgi:hypothetical protein